MADYKDYYAVLGVDRQATPEQIRHAYKRLAHKYHPDISKETNAEEKFKSLQEAYDVLKDPEKRKAYDELGSNWKAGQDFRPPPDWQQRHEGQQFREEDMAGFSDFFSELFGRSRRGGGFEGFQQRGSDQHAKILIHLEEAYQGGMRTLQLQVPTVDVEGRVQSTLKTLKVTIPPGATQGQQLRLAGQGGPGVGGAPAGDLYLEIDIEPHALYSLQGRDVYLTLPVSPWEAALGADIKVPTLGGAVGLKLAPASQSGQKLRLKGRGMPGKPQPGDQYAILQIMTPEPHTEAQRSLYQKMAETMPFNPRTHWTP